MKVAVSDIRVPYTVENSDPAVQDAPYKFIFYNLENLPRLRC
jgi:hypothetical protein